MVVAVAPYTEVIPMFGAPCAAISHIFEKVWRQAHSEECWLKIIESSLGIRKEEGWLSGLKHRS
jgi:hypothetical protein